MGIYGKAILESTQVLNEGKIRDIINKFKKKREEKVKAKIAATKPAERKEITKEQRDQIMTEYESIIKKLKELIVKYNNDPETKKEIRKEVDEYIEANHDSDYKKYKKDKNAVPKIIFDEYETFYINEYGYGNAIIELCNEDQIIRSSMVIATEKIIDELKQKYPKNWHFDFGDGDEGCLYIDYYI